MRIPPHSDGVKPHLQRIEEQQPAHQRVSDAQQTFDRLNSLYASDDSGQHAQHARFLATRHLSGRRGFRVQAAVTGTIERFENRRLSLKPEEASVDVRFLRQHAGVVNQVAGGKVVAPIHHHLVATDDLHNVLGGQPGVVLDDSDVGVHIPQPVFGGFDFEAPDVLRPVQDLALQIAVVHDVEIDNPQRAHPRCRQI